MKKSILAVLVGLCVTVAAQAQNLGRLPGVIFASDRGVKEAATLNDIVAAVGSREVTVVLDAGTWVIDEAVTTPSTMGLVFLPGAKLNVSADVLMTVSGPWLAGDYEIVSGDGLVYGTPSFGYRYPNWGTTNCLNIGSGTIPLGLQELMIQDPAAKSFDTWYTNTVTPGGWLTAYAYSTNAVLPTMSVQVVPSSTMTPTTTVAQVTVGSNTTAALSAAVPYGFLYRVGLSSNTVTGAAYLTGLLKE